MRLGLEATKRADFEAGFALYDSQVELISDPRLTALGFDRVYRGREERIRFQERWAAEWGDLQFAPEELVDLGDGRLAWSVTGAIAFARPDGYMYVMNPDGSGLRQLSSIPCSQPDWSPDGRRLVCSARSNIATMRADGSGFRQLTRGPDYEEGPVFSPGGSRIAFLRLDSSLRKPPSIYTIGSTGGRLRLVARPYFHIGFGPPDWQRLP